MKVIYIWCVVIFFLPFTTSFSITILNSIAKKCEEDSGECHDVCEFEDFQLLPGTGKSEFVNKRINIVIYKIFVADANNTKCLAIFCSEDFTLTVHTCTQEYDPTCTFGHNYLKPFPDCCNRFCQTIVQLD